MRVLFLTLGNETLASSRTRVFQYFPYFKEEDIQFSYFIFRKNYQIHLFTRIRSHFVLLKFLFFAIFYDVVFIQKIFLPSSYVFLLTVFRKKIIFDFDDAIYVRLSSQNTRKWELLKKIKDINYILTKEFRFKYLIRKSNFIILENEYTNEIVFPLNTNVLMITGPIDTKRYYPIQKKDDSKLTIGWIGGPDTTKYFELIVPIFEELCKKYSFLEIKTIGAKVITDPNFKLKQVDWSLETELIELQEFDIGIMPLTDDEWARGKGGYKLLQYMAVGIPSVVSPVGVNKCIIEHGKHGYLAQTSEQWIKYLESLIADKLLRNEMGINARKRALDYYSFEHYAPLLISKLKCSV